MFINNFDPVAFQDSFIRNQMVFFSLYFVELYLDGCYAKRLFIKNSNINEKFDDYITYLIIGIIIGGRLGYIIFYNFNYYIIIFLIFLKFGKVVCLSMVA